MSSSDIEVEELPKFVSNYHFENYCDEPVSFSDLPIKWTADESMDGKINELFLVGTTDDGLQKIYRPVTAWRFDILGVKPDISVLTKDNAWVKLQKPKKSYEYIIRTILITVHCLQIVKRNPESSGKSLWDQMSKIFSLYEVRPSENDLIDHMPLIEEAVKRDESLEKSKFLMAFLKENPQISIHEDDITEASSGFIVDDDYMDNDGMEDDSDDEQELFDSVCAICDNGGELLCCEGICFRSFHATPDAAAEAESECASLGLSKREVEAMQNFRCLNCQYNQHQCFSCGRLGSSDINNGAEVFRCVNATCGHFYHPKCVAKLLHRDDAAAAEELERKIAAGEKFACAMHKCYVCGKGEEKSEPELQFAVCRRCPKSYHRKCLPGKIAFEENEDEGIIQRAWTDLLPDRILIYCLKHEIDEDIGTPVRNHIKFPDVGVKKVKLRPSASLLGKEVTPVKRKLSQRATVEEKASSKFCNPFENSLISVKEGNSDEESDMKPLKPSSKKLKGAYASYSKQSDSAKGRRLVKEVNLSSEKLIDAEPQLDTDSERRILTLMKEASSSVTLDEIFRNHNKLASSHAYSHKTVDRTITKGKVEGSVEAVRTALMKLDDGGTIEDAKAVCEPNVLNQLVKWKNKLKVYLAPFLFGLRYTSFGRHFTKVDKLKEIVDKIHWYVEEGDMIVDFCCGANDFSCLMKEKLEQTGKKCFYRNFDLFRPKNDFNFEERDWMTVSSSELPSGSQLIMGLNPPFGVKASLANKFIDKALEFKPKLIILIVPPETERLDKKNPPYDLVWEDDEKLSGRSFYLPGSVDVNGKQIEDWNLVAPPLFLWSRKDWTAKHTEIAQKHGHLSEERGDFQRDGVISRIPDSPKKERQLPDSPVENCYEGGDVPLVIKVENPLQNSKLEESKERGDVETQYPKGEAAGDGGSKERENPGPETKESKRYSRKRRSQGKNCGEGMAPTSPTRGQKRARYSPNDLYSSSRYSPAHPPDVTRSLDRFSSRNEVPPPQSPPREISDADYGPYQHYFPDPGLQYGSGYGGPSSGYEMARSLTPSNYASSEVTRRYSFETEQRYLGGGVPRWEAGSGVRDHGHMVSDEWAAGSGIRQTESLGYRTYQSEIDVGRPSSVFALESSYSDRVSMPAMQRYAPRLDELNHTRLRNGGGSEFPPDSQFHRSGVLGGDGGGGGRGGVPMGFALGPNTFSHQSSSGWIRE
ncbi:hypothetical protein Nepgr_026877 [Nepenthes gracilis]|uniref:Zinc finger PHD-type domain-containing protein n=1 Tax=Nepenthes gracilis TaxID=150966 RepID=A0AAD3Y2I8_NEPGR|nr:hypothetical protein Nepgr_026877 [Nepenthes gracilis]